MLRTIWLLAAALPLSSIPAQIVHVVGTGGFPQIQTAIAAASSGDVIVIQSGVYQPFTLTKDLTLTAAPGATVDVVSPFALSPMLTVLQPPTRASIVGLRFRNPAFVASSNSQVRVLAGTVAFADVVFESHGYTQRLSGLLVQNANVAMQRCLVLGGGLAQTVLGGSGDGFDGLEVRHATVAAVDCIFMGGALGWDNVGRGGHAVFVDDGNVQLANCIAIGGRYTGFFAGYAGGDGVHIATTSRLFVADSQLQGGSSTWSPGGRGFANLTNVAAVQARSTFVGGAGAPTGAATVGPLATGPLIGFASVTPAITLGTTWTIDYRASPTTPLLAFWSDTLAPAVTPLLVESTWLPAGNAQVAALGLTDAQGLLGLAFPVPSAPALLHRSLFVLAVAGLAVPLEAAPPVGGAIR